MPGPEGAGTQRTDTWRDDFSGGFGVRRDDGTPEAHRALFYSRASGPRERVLTDGAITALNPDRVTSTMIAFPPGSFVPTDVGKRIEIDGAGAAGGTHVATITALLAPSVAQFSPNAATTPVSGATVRVYDRDLVGGGLDPRWGYLGGGPRVRLESLEGISGVTAVGAGPPANDHVIRKLAAFTTGGVTYWLAALGRDLIQTTDPTNWAAGTKQHTFDSRIIDLKVYGSRQGGPELNVALEDGVRHVSYDLVTFTPDGTTALGSVSNRKVVPQSVLMWRASQNQFWDMTNVVTDDNPETGTGSGDITMSAFPTTDWILVGFRHVFDAVEWKMGPHQNGAATVAVIELWTDGGAGGGGPAGWDTTPVVGLTDDTSGGGASLHVSGSMHWTYTASAGHTWTPAVITNSSEFVTEPLYWARVRWTAALDGSVIVQEMKVHYRLQPEAFAVSGTNLVMVVDGTSLVVTPAGGTEGLIYDNTGPFAIPATAGAAFAPNSGEVVAAENLAGTIYVLKTDGVFSVTQGGLPTELAPAMAEQPSVEECQGHAVWNNALYYAHDWELLQVTPDGGVQAIGPERMTFGNQTLQFRATALEPHGVHFLYAAFEGSDGRAYLGAYGVYRHVVDTQTQVESWQRMDVWAIIGDLSGIDPTRRVRAMRVMHGSDNQPWLILGDENGNILRASLPKAFHPLDDHSGYEWSDMHAQAVFPEYDGYDPTRHVIAHRAAFKVRDASATYPLLCNTKGGSPDTLTGWITRGIVTQADFENLDFSPIHDEYGLNVMLVFQRPVGAHDAGQRLEGFGLWYRQPVLGNQRAWKVNVQAHDRVVTLQGKRIPRTEADWSALIRAWIGDGKRLTLVTPLGETRVVMVDDWSLSVGRPNPQGPPLAAYSLTLSSSE